MICLLCAEDVVHSGDHYYEGSDSLFGDLTTTDDTTAQKPVEAVVRLTLGVEAFARMRGSLTGRRRRIAAKDDDVLLAIEHTIQDALRLGQFDPHDDDRGVYVDGLAVRNEIGEFEEVSDE